MPIQDIWGTTDLKMLQVVVELQISNNGSFSLDKLMDKIGLLGRGDSYTGLTPWMVTESLRRLAEADFIVVVKDSEDPESDNEYFLRQEAMGRPWMADDLQKWRRAKERYINEALYSGVSGERGEYPAQFDVSAHWSGGRFFINGVEQLYSVRATPEGLRRVGAWPSPEKFTEELVAILGDIAESIEAKRPEDARTLRQIGRVIRANAIELSAAVLTKLLEHAAGL